MLRGDITGSSLANQYGTLTRREDDSPKGSLKAVFGEAGYGRCRWIRRTGESGSGCRIL
jgi:hypothetical protein